MTATDELRRLLDERGAEYETYIEQLTGFEHVKWNFNEHGSADFNLEFGEPWLTMYGTISGPEQAIAATLGRGTCHDEGDPSDFCCSECGVRMFTDTSDTYTMIASDGRTIIKRPNYCPNCGRRIVDPTTNDVDAEVDDG